MKKMRKILTLALILAFCAGSATMGAAGEPIRIGVIAPLTGPVAIFGIAVRNGVELYANMFNEAGGVDGRMIELIIYDDRGLPTEALNAYNRLVNLDEVVAFIGPVTSGATFGVAEASAEDNIPGITATATHPDVTIHGNNYFRACFLDPFQGYSMARFAIEYLGAETAAVLFDSAGAYSTGLRNAFVTTAAEIGLTIVADESYAAGDVDFSAQLTTIANLAPDVLFLPDYYNTVFLVASQARNAGITATFLGADGTDGVLDIEGIDASVFDGMFFATHFYVGDTSPTIREFISNYEAAFDHMPNSFAALGFDAAKILFDAITRVAATGEHIESTPAIHQAIIDKMAATDIQGVTGRITFDEDNNAVKELTIIKIQDGAYIFETTLRY